MMAPTASVSSPGPTPRRPLSCIVRGRTPCDNLPQPQHNSLRAASADDRVLGHGYNPSCGLCRASTPPPHPLAPHAPCPVRARYSCKTPARSLRLAACLGLAVDLIEPCGFIWSDRRLRRAGMDYLEGVDLTRHSSWTAYRDATRPGAGRLVLLTTAGDTAYTEFAFRPSDTILVGRESAGVPGRGPCRRRCAAGSCRWPPVRAR